MSRRWLTACQTALKVAEDLPHGHRHIFLRGFLTSDPPGNLLSDLLLVEGCVRPNQTPVSPSATVGDSSLHHQSQPDREDGGLLDQLAALDHTEPHI